MSNPACILSRCHRLGLSVWAEGNRIGVAPTARIPPGLLDEIREAKPALLPFLREARDHMLALDRVSWLHTAKQILAGEFNGADGSFCESLFIGLRSINHPAARAALARLAKEPACPANVRRSIAEGRT